MAKQAAENSLSALDLKGRGFQPRGKPQWLQIGSAFKESPDRIRHFSAAG
jgi:hypothetical protein